MLPTFPPDHAQEVEAAAKSSGWPRDMLVFGNTILDLRRIIQCSTFIVEGEHTSTGGPLFGRNLDWPSVAKLHEYTFVIVYRPTGKRAFASITFPGVLGCTTGINDAGLAIAMLDVNSSRDGATGLNPRGTPTVFALRHILERCANIDEALAYLRSIERASLLNVAICDRQRGAVLEVTPKSVVLRPSENGFSLCTNHFRSAELATATECRRYKTLLGSIGKRTYSVPDIAERLHAVNQGDMTLQSMVFEPKNLTLHLAFGAGPASRLPLKRLALAQLFHHAAGSQANTAQKIGP
jgi:predicted choloylglycine hydrolase